MTQVYLPLRCTELGLGSKLLCSSIFDWYDSTTSWMVVFCFPEATEQGLDCVLERRKSSWSDGGLMTACISTWVGGLHQGRQGTTITWLYSMVPITRNMKPSTATFQCYVEWQEHETVHCNISVLHGMTGTWNHPLQHFSVNGRTGPWNQPLLHVKYCLKWQIQKFIPCNISALHGITGAWNHLLQHFSIKWNNSNMKPVTKTCQYCVEWQKHKTVNCNISSFHGITGIWNHPLKMLELHGITGTWNHPLQHFSITWNNRNTKLPTKNFSITWNDRNDMTRISPRFNANLNLPPPPIPPSPFFKTKGKKTLQQTRTLVFPSRMGGKGCIN